MKKKIIIIAVIVVVLAVGIIVGIYLSKDKEESTHGPAYGEEAKEGGSILEKTDFSINMPESWAEMVAPTGVSAMVVNVNEEITEPEAQRINFRTYYSVVYDALNERSKEEYLQSVAVSLKQAIPDIVVTHDEEKKIDNQDIYLIEAEFNQRNIDFKILLVVFMEEEGDVWILTFNALKSSWDDYKDLFYQITESFKLL